MRGRRPVKVRQITNACHEGCVLVEEPPFDGPVMVLDEKAVIPFAEALIKSFGADGTGGAFRIYLDTGETEPVS